MKSSLIFILSILFIESLAHNSTKNHTNNTSEFKTFIVKTKLTKEELEELLAKSETAFLYLRSKENKTHEIKEENKDEMNNIVEEKTDSLEKQIEEEIEREALNPPEEFYVKEMNESKIKKEFIQINENKNVEPIKEKKSGRKYFYLIVFVVIFLIIYFRESLFKPKEKVKKNNYKNLFDSNSNGYEYMLVKSE